MAIACFQNPEAAATCPAGTSCSNLHRRKQHYLATHCLQKVASYLPTLVLMPATAAATGNGNNLLSAATSCSNLSGSYNLQQSAHMEAALMNHRLLAKVELGMQLLTCNHSSFCSSKSRKTKSNRSSSISAHTAYTAPGEDHP